MEIPSPTHRSDAAKGALVPAEDISAMGDGQTIRIMVLGWCLWLIGTWMAALWTGTAVPAARWMLLSTTVGMTVLWPIIRLSLDGPMQWPPPRLVALEWLALTGILQAVIWPLALTAGWGIGQAAWLDAAVMAWSLLAAAVVAVGIGSTHATHRATAAVLCVLLLFGEPVAVALFTVAEPGNWTLRISPFQTLWTLSEAGHQWSHPQLHLHVILAAVAAVLAWIVVVGTRMPTASSSDS